MPASLLSSSSRSILGQLWLALACLCGLLFWGWQQMRELPPQREFQVSDLGTLDGWLQPMTLNPGKSRSVLAGVRPQNSVFFVNGEHGWAVGNKGTILHTQDGGVSWMVQASSTDQNMRAVHFVSAERGWVVGDNGTILHTQDGGVNRPDFPGGLHL